MTSVPATSTAPAERAPGRVPVWATRLLVWAAGLLALAHVLLFLFLVVRRFAYPYDLEWMEGGMLLHARRLLDGKPLYAPPSVDFVPYLYTPLYPAVLAALAKPLGLTYTLGRGLSLASLAAALALGWRAARRAGTSIPVAAAAVAGVLAAFPFVGAWYDVVRNDELFLALGMAGLYVAIEHPTRKGAVLSAALLVASYFAKQTGEALLVVGLVVLVLLNWRVAWAYIATAGLLWGGFVLALNLASHGWFWGWVAKAHARHAFYAKRAFLETPIVLLKQAPAIWAAGLAIFALGLLRRRLGREHVAWLLVGGAGAGLACGAFGTQWAFTNAYIPGVFFPLAALAALAAAPFAPRWLVPAALVVQLGTHFYDPRPYCPTAADRAAGDKLMVRIAETPGDVFIPFHPFYPVMAGKRATVHRMGVMDAPSAGFGRPRGLDDALANGEFAVAILDYKVHWPEFPTLLPRYHIVDQLKLGVDAPRSFSGAETAPLYVLTPRPEHAHLLWRPGFATNDVSTGHALHDLTIDGDHMVFDLVGSADPRGCHVDLVVGDHIVRSATGPGAGRIARIDWDVAEFRGKPTRIDIVDDSRTGSLRLDEVWMVGSAPGQPPRGPDDEP